MEYFSGVIAIHLTFISLQEHYYRQPVVQDGCMAICTWQIPDDPAGRRFYIFARNFGSINIDKFLLAQIISTTIAVIIVVVILYSNKIIIKSLGLIFLPALYFILCFPCTYRFSDVCSCSGWWFLLKGSNLDGAHEAGIYAAAYRLLDASNMVGYLIASFWCLSSQGFGLRIKPWKTICKHVICC